MGVKILVKFYKIAYNMFLFRFALPGLIKMAIKRECDKKKLNTHRALSGVPKAFMVLELTLIGTLKIYGRLGERFVLNWSDPPTSF